MSEQTFVAENARKKSMSSRHALLLSLAGGFILLVLVWVLFLQPARFGVDEIQHVASTTETQEDVDVVQSATGQAAPVALPAITYEVFLNRDPFEPVVEPVQEIVPVEGADPNDPTAPLPDPNASPVDPEAPPLDPGVPVATPGELACSGTGEVVCAGQVVTLVDVVSSGEEPVAIIQIDSTVYEVNEGMPLTDSFVLRGIDGSCVSLLYGDEAFQLCEGDRVMK